MAGLKVLKGNKGEWSEVYVLVKLLAEGKMFAAYENLQRNEKAVYTVIKVLRNDNEEGKGIAYKVYKREDGIKIYEADENEKEELVGNLLVDQFILNAPLLLDYIKAGKKAFSIPELDAFFKEAHITKVTAKTENKADIKLCIYDHRITKEDTLGFSIKSLIGGDSTLFNTGPGNNFIYKVVGNNKIDLEKFNKETYDEAQQVHPSIIGIRLKKLIELGFRIEFSDIESKQLKKNLKMIDGDLPEILAQSLLYRSFYSTASLQKVVNKLEEVDPLNYYSDGRNKQKFYEYKMKKFLTDCAVGMTSEKPWTGEYDANGGVIIAKNDGEVLCFHIYEFNAFRKYLLGSTKFEQPSMSEDENKPGQREPKPKKKYFYGWLYEENGEYFYKINLQIRFT